MKALTIRGSYKGATGHDHLTREMARALHGLGVQVGLWDFSDWSPCVLPDSMRDSWFDCLEGPVDSDIMLHYCMPHQVRIAKGMLNVNYTMFEATRIPKSWVKKNLRHDMVIVPADSSRRAWIDSGFPEERIRLCPLGVDPHRFRPGVSPMELEDEGGRKVSRYGVRVLNVSDLVPRKNLLGLLRVWIRATETTDDAILILKLNCGSEKWLRIFMESVHEMEGRLGKTRKESAPVLFLTNRMLPAADMPGLYAAATHYFSMSCGEGWDLSMMEAAAAGLELMAPDHSAYKAYLDEDVAHMIPARRAPAAFRWSDGLHKLFKGADWWEPEEEAAADRVIRAVGGGQKRKGALARARVAEAYTWERAARRLLRVLEECGCLRGPSAAGGRRRWMDRIRSWAEGRKAHPFTP